jgi:acetyl esterase/lipase
MAARFRLTGASLLLLLSCFVVFPAPNLLFWIVTIGVTEWGHWLAVISLALLGCELRWGRGWYRVLTCIACGMVFVLCSVPFLEAMPIGTRLPGELTAAFGSEAKPFNSYARPLAFSGLWHSSSPSGIKAQMLHYQGKDQNPLELEFFSDSATGERPCIIVVHGGAWHTGDLRQLRAWNFTLANLGYRVASVSYWLAPQYPWPAQKRDVLSALSYLKANASQLGIDPNRFVLLGRSAGSQIALATAHDAHDSSIRGCIASYTPSDMKFDYGTAAEHSILDAHKVVGQFLGGTPDQKPELYRDASPLQLVSADSPPTLLSHGTRDEIVWIENGHKLRDRLIELHRPVYLLELPWATHGFDANPNGPGGQLEAYAIRSFLAWVLPLNKGSGTTPSSR